MTQSSMLFGLPFQIQIQNSEAQNMEKFLVSSFNFNRNLPKYRMYKHTAKHTKREETKIYCGKIWNQLAG